MEGLSYPVQARSQRTLQRVLDATESLLTEKSWLEVGISDIVQAANTSVGSFYARFKDKETLLRYLSARLTDETAENAALFVDAHRAKPLEETVSALARFLFDAHKSRAGLIRTLTVVPRSYSAPSLYSDGMKNAEAFQMLTNLIVQHGIDRSRASLALFVMVTAIRERVLFPTHSKPLCALSERKFVTELSALAVGYLGSNH